MTVFVEGVKIELTTQQVALVEKARRERKRCANSYEKMLLHFGFKKTPKEDWGPNEHPCYQHPKYNWFAVIQLDPCPARIDVWMVGKGLKDGSMPGGWMYSSPELISAALTKAIDEIENPF